MPFLRAALRKHSGEDVGVVREEKGERPEDGELEGAAGRVTWKANKNGVRSFKVKELGKAKEEAA